MSLPYCWQSSLISSLVKVIISSAPANSMEGFIRKQLDVSDLECFFEKLKCIPNEAIPGDLLPVLREKARATLSLCLPHCLRRLRHEGPKADDSLWAQVSVLLEATYLQQYFASDIFQYCVEMSTLISSLSPESLSSAAVRFSVDDVARLTLR